MNSIVLRLKESLSQAYDNSRNGSSTNRIIDQYKYRLKQSVIDLHSLGYPILSFYIDDHLSLILSNHQHNTLVSTIYKLLYTTGRFAHSCSTIKRTRSLCGYVHLHNLQSIHSAKFTKHYYTMLVPHMFYIHLQFLEIILLGGLRPYECEHYQYLKLTSYFTVPFSLEALNMTAGLLFCGTRPPFATIVANNAAYLVGLFNVNSYASFKMKYSAMDLQVSMEPQKGHLLQSFLSSMTLTHLYSIFTYLLIFIKL